MTAGPDMRWSTFRRTSVRRSALRAMVGDERGATAVEFALLCAPFLVLLMIVLQVGVVYMTQSALNTGVVRASETLRRNFLDKPTPTLPAAATLKSSISSGSGFLRNDGSLKVEIRQMTALAGSAVAIADGTTDYGAKSSVLVLRAQTSARIFVPFFSGFAQLRSSAVIRRQES